KDKFNAILKTINIKKTNRLKTVENVIKQEEEEKWAIMESNQKLLWKTNIHKQSISCLEIFEEPVDKALLRLSNDSALYHTASKTFHGHGQVTINAQIPWVYQNKNSIVETCPYNISLPN
ncbi:19068_t:CDS:2, partial [Gigaspora rosea]